MTAFDMGALAAYVKGDPLGMAIQAESTVALRVTHSNLTQTHFLEIRLDMHMTIERVKAKLQTHVGTGAGSMKLYLLDEDEKVVACMDDDEKKLGFYSPQPGFVIHIEDVDPHSLSRSGGLEDVSQVQKYMMSDNDYGNRESEGGLRCHM